MDVLQRENATAAVNGGGSKERRTGLYLAITSSQEGLINKAGHVTMTRQFRTRLFVYGTCFSQLHSAKTV